MDQHKADLGARAILVLWAAWALALYWTLLVRFGFQIFVSENILPQHFIPGYRAVLFFLEELSENSQPSPVHGQSVCRRLQLGGY